MKYITEAKVPKGDAVFSLAVLIMTACSRPESVSDDFAAYYSSYGSPDEISGPFADVVIRFPDRKTMVFSRETSYLPFLVVGKKRWSVEEIIPRKGDGDAVRPDLHNFYSYVRIIRNSEEEIVVHWRYVSDFAHLGFTGVVHEWGYTPAGFNHSHWRCYPGPLMPVMIRLRSIPYGCHPG